KKVNEKAEDIAVKNEMQQQVPGLDVMDVISSGNFIGLANHNAEGTAKLIKVDGKYFIRFEDNFTSTNGPDVHVYLGKNGNYDPSAGKIAKHRSRICGQALGS
ncbi:MAG: hypothetical protein UW81_C0014G0001, partial [Candidatus Giovannonibacteria bacterium GW2011_GWC2_44_9]